MPVNDKKNAISLDYDGCGSILFSENDEGRIEAVLNYLKYEAEHTEDTNLKEKLDKIFCDQELFIDVQKNLKKYMEQLRARFDKLLTENTTNSESMLLIGSNRQDPATDVLNCYSNKTISCFDAYRRFAQQKNIYFCELLLGDIYHLNGIPREMSSPIGTTMNGFRPEILNAEQKSRKEIVEFLRSYIVSPAIEDKLLLIQTQINYVSKYYGENETIDFVFFDDREDLLHLLLKHKESGELQIPPNINMKFMKFNHISRLGDMIIKDLNQQLQTNLGKRSNSSSIENSAKTPRFFKKEPELPQANTASSSNQPSTNISAT